MQEYALKINDNNLFTIIKGYRLFFQGWNKETNPIKIDRIAGLSEKQMLNHIYMPVYGVCKQLREDGILIEPNKAFTLVKENGQDCEELIPTFEELEVMMEKIDSNKFLL